MQFATSPSILGPGSVITKDDSGRSPNFPDRAELVKGRHRQNWSLSNKFSILMECGENMIVNKQHNGMYSFRIIGGLLSLALGGLMSCSSGDSTNTTDTTSLPPRDSQARWCSSITQGIRRYRSWR